MRLTTLARKVKITPSKLMDFLIENGIDIDNGINTKLNKETVVFVNDHFNVDDEEQVVEVEAKSDFPEESAEEAVEPIEESFESTEQVALAKVEDSESGIIFPQNTIPDDVTVAEKEELQEQPKTGTIEDLEEGKMEDIDLIKVKKVKLEGIKVVGKIELPKKTKKKEHPTEEPSEEKIAEAQKVKGDTKSRPHKKYGRKYQKGRKNRKPLSYEEKLKRAEREKKRQRKQKLKKEKERKKAHYEQTVKTKVAQRPKKKKKKQLQSSKKQTAVVHKNPIKRFWAWLNGDYDRY